MKAIRLRTMGDALGTTIDVEVHFAPRAGQHLLDRLIEVARAIMDASKPEGLVVSIAAKCVTRLNIDADAGHITVSACVPEGMTAEQLQRGLLDLLPPPESHRAKLK